MSLTSLTPPTVDLAIGGAAIDTRDGNGFLFTNPGVYQLRSISGRIQWAYATEDNLAYEDMTEVGQDETVTITVLPGQEPYSLYAKSIGPATTVAVIYNEVASQPALRVVTCALNDDDELQIDLSLGDIFEITVEDDFTVLEPLNPVEGKRFIVRVIQGATDGAPAWDSSFLFTTSAPEPTISTGAGDVDDVFFMYGAAYGGSRCMGANLA